MLSFKPTCVDFAILQWQNNMALGIKMVEFIQTSRNLISGG